MRMRSWLRGLSKRLWGFREAEPWHESCEIALEAMEDRVLLASLSIADATTLEGNEGVQSAVVRVTLSAATAKKVTVNYATIAGTAQAGSDYQPVSGQLTFAPGEIQKTIVVPVHGDLVGEPNERLTVKLSQAKGAKISDGQGIVSIVDDEPRITIEGVAWDEYADGRLFPFVVRLSQASSEVVTVNFSTADGNSSFMPDPATWATIAGNDYFASSGTLTFAPGETQKVVFVEVVADDTPEADEYFFVNISGVTGNYFIENSQAFGWIIDDDSDRGPGTEDPGISP